MTETAADMGAFVEDLLLAGAYQECMPLIDALIAAAGGRPAIAPDACRRALDEVAASAALAEACSSLGEQSADEFAAFTLVIRGLGPATVPAIVAVLGPGESDAAGRATQLLGSFGAAGIPALAAGLDDQRWFVQRELARALGAIGTAAAVPPLQSLLRRSDVRVLRTAVAALAGIADPSAARALHTVLRAASGEARAAVISALVGLRDARVAPMLTRILQDSDPFSDDNPLIHDTLNALAALRDERAVPVIAQLARRKRWLSWGRTTKLRQSCLHALQRIGSARAKAAVDDLASTGDFFLKRQVTASRRAA